MKQPTGNGMSDWQSSAGEIRASQDASDCFHCGLPIPDGLDLRVAIYGAERAMCCHGCQAVAEAIVASGHENFYRVRTEAAPSGRDLVPDFLEETRVYDVPEIQRQFVHASDEHQREASLILEGITCAACIWLNEQYIAALPGVIDVRVNYASERALVRWDERRIRLSEILQAVHKIGYRAIPYNPDQQQEWHRRQRRAQQRRLAVAGLFGMQVMMLSIALYAGAFSGMERDFQQFFRWLTLALTLPVLLYSAVPFFTSAWRDLKRARVAMDLPVSLAIGIAFVSSAWATLRGHGEIYFDSVVMFVFFLSASRYFESMARQRCAASVEKLVQSLPLTTTRIGADGSVEEAVAAATIAIGDQVLVRPGETVPADGVVISGESAVDESLLSGESLPLTRKAGDQLLGGSINLSNPLRLEVTAVGADTVLAEIQRTMERAQADKPPRARLADRVAARFIGIVLLIVVAVSIFWWLQDTSRWFEIALAVLIVSCPCALSLATPTAISATLGKLQTAGLLVKNGAALEKLNHVSHVVFDKTGTLSVGQPVLEQVVCAEELQRDSCLRLAASLERHSEHPLARALVNAAGQFDDLAVDAVNSTAGSGVSGRIDGREYFLGSPEFVAAQSGLELPAAWLESASAGTLVALADNTRYLALFGFSDRLREDAERLVSDLERMGKTVILMSGDREAAVKQAAAACAIETAHAQMSPDDKMHEVARLQQQGAQVLMIGDGINDAPVLSRADVSIAMGGASALAKTSADIVLIANRLDLVALALASAGRTRRVILQNMGWALMYNFGAIPAAAMGLVAPWLAAIGMSLSSLVVVLNALRLVR